MEIQNILAHYKRLGKNEDRFVDSFDNIAAQYNDTQLRIISKFLPLNVRAVLEERSPKYQQVMSFNNKISDKLRKTKEDEKQGPSEKLLMSSNKPRIKPTSVVIPTNIDMNSEKKLARRKPAPMPEPVQEVEEIEELEFEDLDPIVPEVVEQPVEPVKKRRGRPRKNPEPQEETLEAKPKRGRGRPRKNPLPETELEEIEQPVENILPMAEDDEEDDNDFVLPGFEEIEEPSNEEKVSSFYDEEKNESIKNTILPGFNEEPEEQNYYQEPEEHQVVEPVRTVLEPVRQDYSIQKENLETIDLSYLLSSDKKIVTFVGTSKNGTSFIVNNLAELLSSTGVNVAILDTTRNKNSYYIYTNNEEELREIATHSIYDLTKGVASGIQVNKNLTVYTSVPNEDEGIENADKILETLLQNHTLILIDTDFETPVRYFKQSQETYLVQTLDILTIQPLTEFLRNLKAKDALDEKKLRIILNKMVRIKTPEKAIIAGMANYNDPAMSFMTKLFDNTLIKYISIPFEEEIYAKYLQNVIECSLSLKGYSKGFMQILRELSNMVYPLTNTYTPPTSGGNKGRNTFTPNMNNTLNQMKNNY